MTILDKLANHAKERVNLAKQSLSLQDIKKQAFSLSKGNFEFERALKNADFAFICECKKASPSKGIIAEDFDYLNIAKEYEKAGANCISVLTEPKWFLGSDKYLKEITQNVSIPCIRKDFTVDEYMIYEAKILGAKAILLICSILSGEQIKNYIKICDDLGLSALVEAHNEDEIKTAINSGARIIGVNNRNLKDFTVDTKNSENLRKLVPKDIIFIAESGITNAQDIKNLKNNNVNGVLIGETLMKAQNKQQKLLELKSML
mgnify:FL=1